MAKGLHLYFDYDFQNIHLRFMVRQKALELGLKGYLRVNEQKQLEIEVEGKNNSIEEFLRFIEIGENFQLTHIQTYKHLKGYTKLEFDIV